jgi:putative addiction module component (TIGR02574 family)
MSEPAFDYRNLSIPERLQLVEDIWDSIAADTETLPLTPDQLAELDRRWEEHARDPASAVPWEQVRDELYRRGE